MIILSQLKQPNASKTIEIGHCEEAEGSGGQDLRAKEQEQEQKCPEIRQISRTVCSTQARSLQTSRQGHHFLSFSDTLFDFSMWVGYFFGVYIDSDCLWVLQKKKDEEKAREKELNDLFKIAVVQPKVPLGMFDSFHCC